MKLEPAQGTMWLVCENLMTQWYDPGCARNRRAIAMSGHRSHGIQISKFRRFSSFKIKEERFIDPTAKGRVHPTVHGRVQLVEQKKSFNVPPTEFAFWVAEAIIKRMEKLAISAVTKPNIWHLSKKT
ncbi:hypothetical protein M9H77_16988 [Catharanthus roseus]|uniref:Uncharacterized protein n=1 Tax=Catharanthus roseus TaxID=4058 RepID=A0ACC0B3A4_CATRO|nr:hypothetical protein M9H77_16988 [Catharanthus roseus]